MNPVKAGISTKEEAYRFSSYKNYISKSGNVNNKLLEIVFNNEKDYLKIMNLINYESLNLEKEDINLEEVLNLVKMGNKDKWNSHYVEYLGVYEEE